MLAHLRLLAPQRRTHARTQALSSSLLTTERTLIGTGFSTTSSCLSASTDSAYWQEPSITFHKWTRSLPLAAHTTGMSLKLRLTGCNHAHFSSNAMRSTQAASDCCQRFTRSG